MQPKRKSNKATEALGPSYVQSHTYTHTHTHIYIYIYIHTHTHEHLPGYILQLIIKETNVKTDQTHNCSMH